MNSGDSHIRNGKDFTAEPYKCYTALKNAVHPLDRHIVQDRSSLDAASVYKSHLYESCSISNPIQQLTDCVAPSRRNRLLDDKSTD